MSKIRLGFIGAGGIAHRHFGVLQQFDDVEIIAVADVDIERATSAANRCGARGFEDYSSMLEEAKLDAVFICVPPFAHGGPEREAIRHGLPFFVEKPVSLDIAVAEEIATLVRDTKLVTATGYHWRYLDGIDEVREILRDSPARLISGYWLDSTPPPQWWWRQEYSGGQMVEQTTHIIDLARYLVGEPVFVFGSTNHLQRPDYPELDVPVVSTANLRFDTGAIGNLSSTCLLRWSHRVALHLFGDGVAVELTDRDLIIDQGRGRRHRAFETDPVVREDRDFIDAVKSTRNAIRCPYEEALRTHRVALAIGESARRGEPLTVVTQREPAAQLRTKSHA